ncbi:MAG: flagellar hook capping FlgD N-terminal domain-containing protein [Planctomycetota bacterium]
MSDISSVSTAASTSGTTQLTSESDRATISRGEFLEILIAELTYQDPFEPMSNSEFAQQIAQIESMRSSEELTEGIGALLKQQQITSAGALIGKTVYGGTENGGLIEGVVDSVTVDSSGVYLAIDGYYVPLNNVFEISPEQSSEEET